jgi:hypothetical protein
MEKLLSVQWKDVDVEQLNPGPRDGEYRSIDLPVEVDSMLDELVELNERMAVLAS